MAKCHTDCIEKPLVICFQRLGYFIGSHPLWFLIIPLILAAGLGSGFYFLDDRLSNDLEKQFTPSDGQAKTERKYVQETFPGNDSMFSSLRLSTDGNFATFIATNDRNILTVESLQEILQLDSKIRSMVVEFDGQSIAFKNVCAVLMGSCISNDILDVIDYNATHIEAVNLTYPWYFLGFQNIPLYRSLGSVKLYEGTSRVENAQAIQLYYYLREEDKSKTDLWLKSFINLVANEPTTSIRVSYSTSMSRQWEFEESPDSVISLFSITYTIVITFSILSCWRMDNVRSKVWVATCGVIATGMAVLSGFGMLLLIGEPFVMTAASCPFLILGIGIDDMFIMISCWQRTKVHDSVPERLSNTYREAAISITITTLTDALALFLGCITSFGSVRSFCLYAGISICFCYLYNITFLGACMALNGQREGENKHWFTCAKILEDVPDGKSKASRICCFGGRYDQTTGNEESELMSRIFEKKYGPFLTHKVTKSIVGVIYVAYLAVSIYGCTTLQEGLDISNLALDDSYIKEYYDDERLHFSEYYYSAMVVIKQPIAYWDKEELKTLDTCIADFESLKYVNNTFAWFRYYQEYANGWKLNISYQEAYQTNLTYFLASSPLFREDINMTADGVIQASRFFIQTLDRNTEDDMMTGLRTAAENCPIDLLVYHPAFIYFDQYTVIVGNTIQTLLVAVVVMLIIALVLIPSPVCSLWVVFAICSVIVGVTGFMALWSVSLDSISMINLIMSIGFSVDFSAHISYAFVSSSESDVNKRAMDALAQLGYPVLQGALSTILGVLALSFSKSYIFRTFFKVMFLVITFGVCHGLMFIPVFLTLFGVCKCC
ncbi:patched domain-containing protein 3 [Hippoglossus stenolepis]|uniref:patched domain-containing protein 3 n=1 Tax=Hippoglossus stenolepis TaxID=195615 RepID=UPI00159C92F0|nr:patched domain-containing protein 3 [Hippoglossus stenolepis]